MTDELTIADILAAARAIAAFTPPEASLPPGPMPVAATLAEAHFRAESAQRAVLAVVNGQSVTVYPIGTRPL